MIFRYLKIFPTIVLCYFFAFCSNPKPVEDLIYGEYQWTKRNKDGSRDKLTILKDGSFIQKINRIETKGSWREITDLGDYKLRESEDGYYFKQGEDNDWDWSFVMFTFPNGNEQAFVLSTPFYEFGNCRSIFRQRRFEPIDTWDSKKLMGAYERHYFSKVVDIKNKDFPGCQDADISRAYSSVVNDENYGELGTAYVDIDYEASTRNGSWTYAAEWKPQFKRLLPSRGQGAIIGDTLFDGKLGTVALGYMRIDTLCCDHTVNLVVGTSLESFR